MRYRKSISYAPLLRKCKSKFWWPNPGLSHFSKILSKTLIFLKLRGAGKFTSWFFDVLGPTHHPVSKLKNDTIFLSILILDLLLKKSTLRYKKCETLELAFYLYVK
jgi:hypothetical protein